MTPDRRRRRQSQKTSAPRVTTIGLPRPWQLVMLALVVAFAAIVRIRMLNIPLERDEGEYAYAGQLILQGVPPYSLAYNMKLPGIYAAYALVLAVFGESPSAIHWGLLLVNAIAIVLVFALANRLFGSYAGIVAAASYAILSVSQSVVGTAAHATQFVVAPALGGVLLLLKADEQERPWGFFWGGFLLGLAFVMKQHGAVFIMFGLAYVLSIPLRRRPTAWAGFFLRGGFFSAGVVLPFALTCLILLRAGVFDKFWFWTFSYAREYATETPIADVWQNFTFGLTQAVGPSGMLWALAGVGSLAVWWRKERRAEALFISALLVFSFLGVCPGFYFRPHYFILLLPTIAILVGAAVAVAAQPLARNRFSPGICYGLPALLFAIPFGQSLSLQRATFFERTPYEVCRKTYGLNPFPEAVAISRYISAHSTPTDRIAVLGSEPEVYFYSRRRSATGHIYTYGLMEKQRYAKAMQQEMIREIEAARPEYLLFINIPTSWLAREGSEQLIVDWYLRYTREHYDLVGVIELPPTGEAIYHWDAETVAYLPRFPYGVNVFRRRSAE